MNSNDDDERQEYGKEEKKNSKRNQFSLMQSIRFMYGLYMSKIDMTHPRFYEDICIRK